MDSSEGGRCSEIAGDLAIVLVTVIQLIFFAFFYEYIAWYTKGPDGSIVRLPLLTDDYFTWLPFPVTASILVIVVSMIMIIYNRYWFRQAAWILFSITGLVVVVSLLLISPFDFSVIPNAKTADLVPTLLTLFLILMAVFYIKE